MKLNPTYILAGIAAFAVVCCLVLLQILMEDGNTIQGLQSANNSLNAELQTRVNNEGKIIAEKQAAELRVQELTSAMPKLAEQIKRDFDIEIKRLRGYMESSFQARGSGNALVLTSRIPFDTSTLLSRGTWTYFNAVTGDTTMVNGNLRWKITRGDTILLPSTPDGTHLHQEPQFAILIQDGYLDAQVDVYDSLTAPYTYTYTDTAKMAFHDSKKWLLGKKTLYGSVMLSNPNAKITNTQSFMIDKAKDLRWGIGPYFGWGVNEELQPQFSIGISVQYSLIKF